MPGVADACVGKLTIRGRPVDAEQALARADRVICHGGNLAQQAAAAGVPVLALSLQYEQLHTARVLERRAGGAVLLQASHLQPVADVVNGFINDTRRVKDAVEFGKQLRASGAEPFDSLARFALDARVAAAVG